MSHVIVYDCEFLTAEGAMRRFWCGPKDPDPIVAQIGLVKISLDGAHEILDRLKLYVLPLGRDGARVPLDPMFVSLTGVTEADLDEQGVSLEEALHKVEDFADGARLWSWGKDEFNMLAISCYVQGIAPPIPITRFGNAAGLLLGAGMPYEDIKRTSSNQLADYYEIEHPPLKGHDALDDALSVAYVVQHLLTTKKLKSEDCL